MHDQGNDRFGKSFVTKTSRLARVLLVTASVIALCGGSATAVPLKPVTHSNRQDPLHILYSQNSNDGGVAINSQNYTSGSSFDNDQAADDFVIPRGQVWRIREVDVVGAYIAGSGPATSENVTFYKNKKGVPGDPVTNGMFNELSGTGGPNFALVLPGKGLKLKAGRYWVSVVANEYLRGNGAWGWEVNSGLHGKFAVWKNPYNGFGTGCTTWQAIENCLGQGPDLMFTLRGSVR